MAPSSVPGGPSESRDAGRLERALIALFLIAFYYNWYRYPFQINSTDTSPTYRDTPLWLSLGKYGLIAAVLAYLAFIGARGRGPARVGNPLDLFAFIALAAVPIAGGLAVAEPELAQMGFFFLVSLALLAFHGRAMPVARCNRMLEVTVCLAVLVQALQVALFFVMGRLPGLAYRGSISVRFGSFLDDPNSFGLLVAGMLPFVWVRFRGAARAALTAGLYLSAILSQSLTAVGAVVVVTAAASVLALARADRSVGWALAGTLAAAVALGVALYAVREPLGELYALFIATKEGSILGHAESLEIVRNVSPLSLVGIEPAADLWGESGYINMLAYFGLPYVLVYLCVGALAIWRYYGIFRRADRERRAFAAFALGLLAAVYLANANLPILEIFPLNLLSATLLGIAAAGVLRRAGPADHAASTRSITARVPSAAASGVNI